MLVLAPHEKLAPQSHDLPASLMPIPHPHPKLFRFPCMSSSHSWGACPVAQGQRASSRSPARPHPQHTCFLAPPDAALRVPRTNQSSQNSTVKGLLYVPRAAGRGLFAPHCPGPAPEREGSASQDWPWPSHQPWGGGRDWLCGEWMAALGGCWLGPSLGWAPGS